MSGGAIAEALDRAISSGQNEDDHSRSRTEFTSRALDEWAYRRGVSLALAAATSLASESDKRGN